VKNSIDLDPAKFVMAVRYTVMNLQRLGLGNNDTLVFLDWKENIKPLLIVIDVVVKQINFPGKYLDIKVTK
jgi:hypothetical protein